MTKFIEWLEEIAINDSKVRAVLRRSLSFEPGTYVEAFSYVEKFVKRDANPWNREMHYLVAGLWAMHWKEGRTSEKQSLGKAYADHWRSNNCSTSIEKRFIVTLDADQSQLAYRLRQLVVLLKEYPIDFSKLLNDLLWWKLEKNKVQIEWARDFYREPFTETETLPKQQLEII